MCSAFEDFFPKYRLSGGLERELRSDGLKLHDLDRYDSEGTLVAGPSFEPEEDYGNEF